MPKIAFDLKLMRPGCALLQAVLGGKFSGLERYFPSETWLVAPTADQKVYDVTETELHELARRVGRPTPKVKGMANVHISTDKLIELIQNGYATNESISRAVGVCYKHSGNPDERSDGIVASLRRAKKAGAIQYNKSTRRWEVVPKETETASAATE